MATSLDPDDSRRQERRKRVLVGPLPPDFLTLGSGHSGSSGASSARVGGGGGDSLQEQMDEQAAIALHQQLNAASRGALHHHPAHHHQPTNIRGRLLISVMQAKLVKNYGMTRMDPYVRIHIGHHIYETPTDVNGAKNPKWNKTIQCFLPLGINQIYLEIYDECNFSVDELIGHANIIIPEEIFKGETNEEWYPLNGKQGEGKEGQILLVFSFMAAAPPTGGVAYGQQVPYVQPGHPPGGGHHPHSRKAGPPVIVSGMPVGPAMMGGGGTDVPEGPRPQFSEDDFKQLKEMFPNMDEEVVRSVYEAAGFSKDSAANALLQMIAD